MTTVKVALRRLTSTFCLAHTSPDLAGADHAQALCLVERSDFLFRLAEGHAVLQLAEFRLRVRLLCFARPSGPERQDLWCVILRRNDAPLATATLLWAVIRYGQGLHDLAWWRGSEPIHVLLYLLAQILAVGSYQARLAANEYMPTNTTDRPGVAAPDPFETRVRTSLRQSFGP
jgi:hypothetical protein